MLSCIILAGSIFITGEKQAVRIDAIDHISRAGQKRIEVEYSDGSKSTSFFHEGLQDDPDHDPDLNPAQLVAQAIAPCEAKLASQ